MFMENIISDSNLIFKFLKELQLDLFLSKPQFKHFNQFLNLMMSETYNGNISAVQHCHRTNFGRFLNDSPQDGMSISKPLQDDLISCIYNRSSQTKHPIYVMVDDTTCVKTKPSSQVIHPIQGCGWNFSHHRYQHMYGHPLITMMLRCDDLVLPYQIIPYEKDKQSKIEFVQAVLMGLSKLPHTGYMDCQH